MSMPTAHPGLVPQLSADRAAPDVAAEAIVAATVAVNVARLQALEALHHACRQRRAEHFAMVDDVIKALDALDATVWGAGARA